LFASFPLLSGLIARFSVNGAGLCLHPSLLSHQSQHQGPAVLQWRVELTAFWHFILTDRTNHSMPPLISRSHPSRSLLMRPTTRIDPSIFGPMLDVHRRAIVICPFKLCSRFHARAAIPATLNAAGHLCSIMPFVARLTGRDATGKHLAAQGDGHGEQHSGSE
jgi:hypothetical protein